MDVYLINETKNEKFWFPVNPQEKLSAPKQRLKRTETLLVKGEVDIHLNGKTIQEISFESFFPAVYDSAYCRYLDIPKPLECKNKFDELIDSDDKLRIIIDEFGINESVNVDNFKPEMRAGEIGDIYYSITFRTHQPLKVTTVNDSEDSYQGGLSDYNNRSFDTDEYQENDKIKVVLKASLYEENSQNSTKLGEANIGDTLTVYTTWGEWLSVYWGMHGAFIHKGFVTKA